MTGRVFFFEKRTKNFFDHLQWAQRRGMAQMEKSFCFFFFRKRRASLRYPAPIFGIRTISLSGFNWAL